MTVAESMKMSRNSTKIYQLFSVLSVSYLCISCGNFLGYTSSALPSMDADHESFEERLTKHDKSWIGGLGPLGALFGSVFALLPLRFLGPRRTVAFFGCTTHLMSWTMIAFSQNLMTIFIGRFLGGFGTGIIIPSSSLFVVDVASVEIRGKLGILPQFLMIAGILISYILGSFLDWRLLALASCTVAGPSILFLILAPDTPSWLVSKQRFDDAYEILEKLLGPETATTRLREIRSVWDTSRLPKEIKSIGVRKERLDLSMIKASAVALGVLSFQQLTGINGVTFYALSIFKQSAGESTLNPHIPSVILATTQLIASFTSTLIVERAGRRVLLLISTAMICGAGTILGIYFYYGTQYSFLAWVPLAALIGYTFGFAIGLGPITWLIASELFPAEVRHFMNPLGIAYSWFCVFLVTKSFPLLNHEIHIYGIFWLYAGVALIGFLFVALFVPETKGKTITEIRDYFKSDKDGRRILSRYASDESSDSADVEASAGLEEEETEEDATKCLTAAA